MLPALAGNNLVGLVGQLARGFPDRVFGTDRGLESARWLANRMAAIGLQPIDGSFLQTFSWEVAGEQLVGHNVAGLLEGTDPELKHEYIIIAAHHDSQHDTHEGANDNATGCAGVLAVAEALAKNPPKRSVLFLTFDGEEGIHKNDAYHPGRRGSKHYAANPLVPLSKTALLVNMDMIGQVHLESGSRRDVYQWASDDAFAAQVLRRASESALRPGENAVDGYPEQPRESQFFTTDAEPLYRLGVPTINLLSGRDLENHHPRDAMARILPERLEQYVRLAHACAVEAGNHPESLADLRIAPGGLFPAFPLIRERKSAGLHVVEEEQRRLDDLAVRLPELKQAAAKLAAQVIEAGHVEELSEPALDEVRKRRDALIEQLHRTDKRTITARAPLAKQIETLGAIADVLAGAIYLAKIDKTGAYYVQRIPEKLADLLRGAERLGMDAELEGIVRKSDVEAFSAPVNADRAVTVARAAVANLSKAVGQAVYAAWKPEQAAAGEPVIGAADARALHAALVETARAVAGELGPGSDVKRAALAKAMLDAQVSGVKGTGERWLARFAGANALTDFADAVEPLGLLEAEAKGLEEALASDDVEALEAAVLAFYRPLTELAFGRSIEGIDELSRLDRDRVEELMALSVGRAEQQLIEAGRHDPAVQRLSALSELLEASLSFASLYRRDGRALKRPVTLRTVKERLDRIEQAAKALDGGEQLAGEIRFWSDWVEPYVDLEPLAREQAKQRAKIAQDGLTALDRLRRATNADVEEARQALATLENAPSPKAEERFSGAVDELVKAAGEPARALVPIVERLQQMNQMEGATLGRAGRSGPLGVLSLRAKREE